MQIIPYHASMAPEVASVYNRTVSAVPHCYPVDVERFAAALPGSADKEPTDGKFIAERVMVATEGGSIVGFSHAAIGKTSEDCEGTESERCFIRFLCYDPGRRMVGQALLQACEGYASQHNTKRITAFQQGLCYRFYHLPHAYLSTAIGHVHALLGFNGYRPSDGEVYLDWPDYEPVEPTPPRIEVDISLHWDESGAGRPTLTAKAHRGDEHLGDCHSICAARHSGAEQARDWAFTVGLDVAGGAQGCGLGRYLLRRAINEMHAIGYRHAAISAAWDNWRALLLYSNHGYRVADLTYGYTRLLKDG